MIDLLYLLSERNNFLKYERFRKDNVLTKETKVIVNDMREYYDSVITCDKIDWSAFETWFRTIKHPMYKEDKHEIFQKIFQRVTSHKPDKDVLSTLIDGFVAKDFATRIYMVAQDVAEGNKGRSALGDVDDLFIERR